MVLATILVSILAFAGTDAGTDLEGAWKHVRADGTIGAWIVSDGHFSIAWYRADPPKFVSTEGGTLSRAEDGAIRLTYEFDTADPARVGTSRSVSAQRQGGGIVVDGATWMRVDAGTPGSLEGAWLMTGRKRDGEISMRRPGARRTMKILSGTRFQWIAYNVETREFFGSGGGTYRTAEGTYTESIEFFSRDDTRSGRSLEFRYELIEGAWHHVGKSTAGEPMHEVWSRRGDLGI